MKQINKLSVKIAIALLIGFLYAGAFTSISHDGCKPPIDGAQGCATIEKAVMHPGDLLDNKQDSMVRFFSAFASVSIGTLALLSVAAKKSK